MNQDACAAWVGQKTGLEIERGSARALRKFVGRRCRELGLASEGDYLALLQRSEAELQGLVDCVTVTHTWFFRDLEQLQALKELMSRETSPRIRVWVAGCATGEEAYTVALIAHALGRAVRVLGTDLNSSAVGRAASGRYAPLALRTLPDGFARYLERLGPTRFQVVDAVRRDVGFEVRNILHAPPGDGAEQWDFILCRNVLMYFSREHMECAIRWFRTALRPGGYLLLGPSDALLDVPSGFRAETVAGRVVYRRGEGHGQASTITTDVGGWTNAEVRASAGKPMSEPACISVLAPRSTTVNETAPRSPLEPARTSEAEHRSLDDYDDTLGRAHRAMVNGELTAARSEYLRATEQRPIWPAARLHLGVVCYFLGDLESALHALRGCLLLDERCWLAAYYLAASYEGLGLASEARREYQHAARLADGSSGDELLDAESPLLAFRDDLLWLARQRAGRKR